MRLGMVFSLFLLTWGVVTSASYGAMQIIAHRGASFHAPENTLAAIKEAWKQDADGVEVDIHLTKDGKIVVMHDASLLRTTGHAGWLRDLNWEEIASLEAGSWKGENFLGEPIPLLTDILEAIPGDKTLFIELKGGGKRLAQSLAEVLSHYEDRRENTVIIAFDYEILHQFKKLSPGWRAFCLTAYRDSTRPKTQEKKPKPKAFIKDLEALDDLLQFALAAGFDGINFEYSPFLTREIIEMVKQTGLEVAIWTHVEDDTCEKAKHCAQLGAAYFTTNRPGQLKSELGKA